jgi:hypothetical protein
VPFPSSPRPQKTTSRHDPYARSPFGRAEGPASERLSLVAMAFSPLGSNMHYSAKKEIDFS